MHGGHLHFYIFDHLWLTLDYRTNTPPPPPIKRGSLIQFRLGPGGMWTRTLPHAHSRGAGGQMSCLHL